MTENPEKPISSSPVRLHITLFIWFGLISVLNYYHAFSHDYRLAFFGLLYTSVSAISLFAAHHRFGWTVPCLIIGVMLGFFLDPLVKHGPHMAHIEETVFIITFWTVVGLVVGIIIDFTIHQPRARNEETDQ